MNNTKLTVALSNDFFKAYGNLPAKAQSKVAAFIGKFRDNPRSPGLNYEHIDGGKDKQIRSLRVDQEIRCIVRAPEQGNTYVLLWIDKHDEAYQWARRKTCHVNRISGALQVMDVEAAKDAVAQGALPTQALFSACGDDQLMLLGVPEALLPAVRAVGNQDELGRLIEWVPQACVDGLILLAEGHEITDVLDELERQQPERPVDLDDVATALNTPESQAEFLVLTDDDELEAMLSAPLEQWRVFLHPSQRRLIERNWNGPVRVLGGAGTGKTVVAMHRARWLAKQWIDAHQPGRILFTTFTRNLATDIRSNLTKICTSEELKRIEVVNLDRWVMGFIKDQGLTVRVFSNDARQEAWDAAMNFASTEEGAKTFSDSFYKEEWRDVVLANDCRSRDDYLQARRIGRGTRLTRQDRAQIWPVFDALRGELRQRGLWEPEEAKQLAADRLKQANRSALFQAVIVDEAQDLDVASFRLIRALAGPTHVNDLFIVGDPHQRIYGKPVVLGHCGIEIRGRSRKLRINYRTTEETRAWATSVLHGLNFDDLDGGADPSSDYRSLLHGDHPLVQGFQDPADEQKFLLDLIRQIQSEQGTLASTCIAARSKTLEAMQRMLKRETIAHRVIEADEADDPSDPSLRLATMHRVKGLEFDQVLIPGLTAEQMPHRKTLSTCPDTVSKELFEQQERSLLHVAATRAKKRVVVSYSGQPSTFLSIADLATT